MNHISKTGFTLHDLRLIGAALAMHQVERVEASITPLPGTGRFIVVGTPAEVARLLEIAPAQQVDCGGSGDFIGGMPCLGCSACPVDHDHSEGGHHD